MMQLRNNPSEKLQKVLARSGLGSRRHAEKLIESGRIEVNGKPASLGKRVTQNDQISLDQAPIDVVSTTRTRLIIYHKPVGVICSRRDPQGRLTVFKQLPRLEEGRWLTVGRLDINTSGLLLVTNDGDLAHRLMHPSAHLPREYLVRVYGKLSLERLEILRKGVKLVDGFARFKSIDLHGGEHSNRWYRVTVEEGRNRLVRRMFQSQDLEVSRLIRIKYGPVHLPRDLQPGQWQEVPEPLLQELLEHVNYEPETENLDC